MLRLAQIWESYTAYKEMMHNEAKRLREMDKTTAEGPKQLELFKGEGVL